MLPIKTHKLFNIKLSLKYVIHITHILKITHKLNQYITPQYIYITYNSIRKTNGVMPVQFIYRIMRYKLSASL